MGVVVVFASLGVLGAGAIVGTVLACADVFVLVGVLVRVVFLRARVGVVVW